MFIGNIFSILYFFCCGDCYCYYKRDFYSTILWCTRNLIVHFLYFYTLKSDFYFILFFSFLHDLFYDFIIFLFVFCCCFSLLCFEWHDVITNMDTLVFVSLFTKKKYRQFISFFRYFFLFFFFLFLCLKINPIEYTFIHSSKWSSQFFFFGPVEKKKETNTKFIIQSWFFLQMLTHIDLNQFTRHSGQILF